MLAVLIAFGLVAGIFSGLFPTRIYLKLASQWHLLVTKIVGINCSFSGVEFQPGTLVVSNHISWLDISVIASKFPVVFLAKSEIEGWPVLGWVIKKAGTIFIKRGQGASEAITALANSLEKNQSVFLFPEGKTTDGSSVIRFQPRLFQSAIDSQSAVQPMAISYQNNNEDPAKRMAFHGDTEFLSSLWRTVSGNGGISAKVHIFEPIPPGIDRDLVSQNAEEQVRAWIEK